MPIFCPFCGEKLIDGAKFCKNCGKNVETYSGNSSDNNYQYTPPAAEKSHTLALVLGIIFDFLIPLIGIIIGVYLYTRKDSSKAKTHGLIVIALGIIIWAVSAFLGFAMMIR